MHRESRYYPVDICPARRRETEGEYTNGLNILGGDLRDAEARECESFQSSAKRFITERHALEAKIDSRT